MFRWQKTYLDSAVRGARVESTRSAVNARDQWPVDVKLGYGGQGAVVQREGVHESTVIPGPHLLTAVGQRQQVRPQL